MSAIRERAIRRGRLLERITQQRMALQANSGPLVDALNTADRIIEGTERAKRWVADNPLAVGLGVCLVIIWRPKGALKLVSKGILGWRTWRAVRQKLGALVT